MNADKQRKIGILLGYANIAVGALLSIIYTPFLVRRLGPSEHGIYTIAFSVVGYLNLLGFGLNGSYLRFCSKYMVDGDDDGLARLNGTFVSVNMVIFVLTLLVGGIIILGADAFFASSLTPDEIAITKKLLVILVINMAITFPMSVFSSYITAHENFIFLKGITVLRTICSPLAGLMLLLAGYRSFAIVLCTTIINVAVEAIHALYAIFKLRFKMSLKRKHDGMFKSILGFSAFVFIQSITDQLNWSVDSIIIAKIMGSVATSVYGLASQLNGYVRQFSTIFSSVFAPKANKLIAQKAGPEAVTDFYIRVARLQFLIAVFILTGFALFGRYFMQIWGGEGYEESYYIAVILILAITPAMFMNLGIEIRRAMNMHRQPAIMTLVTAVINACVTVPLVFLKGGTGAALGTLAACIFNSSYMTWYYKKKLGLDMGRFWKQMLLMAVPCLPSFLIGLGARLLYSVGSIPVFAASIVGYTIVFWGIALAYAKLRHIPLLKGDGR